LVLDGNHKCLTSIMSTMRIHLGTCQWTPSCSTRIMVLMSFSQPWWTWISKSLSIQSSHCFHGHFGFYNLTSSISRIFICGILTQFHFTVLQGPLSWTMCSTASWISKSSLLALGGVSICLFMGVANWRFWFHVEFELASALVKFNINHFKYEKLKS
jgi:hypothetical protein